MIFVEHTRGEALASALKGTIQRLNPMLRFKMKVVENAGSSLASLLLNKNPCAGSMCGRKTCFPCKQVSEKVELCTLRNIVYETKCVLCNGLEKGKEEGTLADTRDEPSIYVGEGSTSLQERALEHQKDYKKGHEDSNMLKHWVGAHTPQGPAQAGLQPVLQN